MEIRRLAKVQYVFNIQLLKKLTKTNYRPQIVVQHFRRILQILALCQIQRAIANGRNIPGYLLPQNSNLLKKDSVIDSDPTNDMNVLSCKRVNGTFITNAHM